MPPAAATVAGRRTRQAPAPKAPRRVSGPVAPPETRPPARPAVRTSARAAAAAAALEGALAPAPARTRREAPRREAPRRREAPTRHRETEALPHAAPARRRDRARELPRIDRIIRGRTWIPLLGVLLVAIVGLRVEVLKLGSSVGRELQQATTLESSNAVLRSQVSELSGNQRIEQLASGMGMVMPGPMDIHFVKASSISNVGATASGIHAPARSDFLSSVASERQSDADNTIAAAANSAVGVLATGVSSTTSGTSSDASSSTTDSTSTPSDSSVTSTDTTSPSTATSSTGGTTADSSGDTSSTTGVVSSSTSTDGTDSAGGTSDSTVPTGPTTGGASLAG